MNTIKKFLEYELFSIYNHHLYVYEVITVVIIISIALVVDWASKRFLYKSTKIDTGTQYALYQILHYVLIIITFALCTRVLGINISPLLVGSGAVLVGIGLGLQNLFLDFISGVIILVERSIRIGDILDIEGVMGQVIRINIRATHLQTTDKRVIILPNSKLTKNKLINYSSHTEINSFSINVGVDYNSDLELVKSLLLNAANEHPDVSTEKPSYVRFDDFGNYQLSITLHFFTQNVFHISRIKSEIRMSILNKFRENNINMPFPVTTIDFPSYTDYLNKKNQD